MFLSLGLATLSTTVVFSALPDGGVPLANSAPAAATEASVIISTRERLIQGTEPHSLATSSLAIGDPQNRRLASSETGSTGLMHLSGASVGAAGLFRVSGLAQYL